MTLLDRIRDSDGCLLQGIDINPIPVWEAILEYRSRGAWRPLLRPVIELGDMLSAVSEPAVHEDGIRVDIRISHSVLLPRLDQLGPEGTPALEFLRNTGGTPILDYSKFAFGFEPNSRALG